ncbi:MAG: DUF2500 domain-containing protein [Pirellulales bacterium]|nr:DUF2500 domain-containing protein [Pirellulales bacterium]
MKCTSCGADIRPGSVLCEYCDSTVEMPTVNGNRTWLFEHVKQSAEYARRTSPERLAAMPNTPLVGNLVGIGFLVLWTLVAGFMTLMFLGHSRGFGGPPAFISIVPMGFVALGVFALVMTIKKTTAYSNAPIESRPAVIVGKRTRVSGGSGDSSASTAYFLTAEFEDGRRREFRPAKPDLFGRLAEGDAGVLFSRTDFVLDFDRVANG